MEDDKSIARLSGEFRARRLERRFRDHQAPAELRQLRLLWLVALSCFAAYLPVEVLLRGAPLPWSQLWPRLGILGAGVAVLLLLQWPAARPRRDWISSAGLLTAMVCYGCLLAARDSGGSGALLLLLLGSYMFSPGRFNLHCVTGIGGSLLAAWLASPGVPLLELSYLLPANVLSALALSQFNRSRRGRYLRERRLALLHARNRALLYNALPRGVARQLRDNPRRRPVRFEPAVTVLFADIVGFSGLSRNLSPTQLLALLDSLFSAFDRLADRHRLEKIKTVGDSYLAVAGLASADSCAALKAASMAQSMHVAAAAIGRRYQLELSLRVALHNGPVVAGVLGSKRFAFDVWGDTVNVASRLQAEARVGTTLVSEATRLACRGQLRVGPGSALQLRGCGTITAAPLEGFSGPGPSLQQASPLPPPTAPRRRC